MAKFGAGLDAQRIQSGAATPTPSETLQEVLSKTLGSLSQQVEIPTEEAAAPQSLPPVDDLTQAPPPSDTFTESGDLIPLTDRIRAVKEGQTRTQFDQWEPTGRQVSADLVGEINFGPDYTNLNTPKSTVNTPANPLNDMLLRSVRTAELMNPAVTERVSPDGTVVPVPTISLSDTNVTTKELRTRYMDINKRINQAASPEEEAALRRERDELVKPENRQNTILSSYLGKLDALKIEPDGRAFPDQKFLNVGVLATEHELDGAFMGNNDTLDAIIDYDENGNEVVSAYSAELLNPSDLAQRVGQSVAKWWGSEKAGRDQPINRKSLSTQEQKDIGAAFLLSYAKANPDLVEIVRRKKDETTGEFLIDKDGTALAFKLTPKGQAVYDANRALRQEALGITIDPKMTPEKGGLKGEAQIEKPTYRKKRDISGQGKSKAYATLEEYEEAIDNLNSVAHVVDDRRLRIASVMAIPTLYTQVGNPKDKFGDTFGLGRSSVDALVMEKKFLDNMQDADALKEAISITQSKKRDIAEDLSTLALFRKMSNYLTHAMQPLAGRLMAQQTRFNPTRKKLIRFVTRSKHPAKITKRGSVQDRAYRNIMALSFGQDSMLENGRFADLDSNQDKYYNWGRILEEALNSAFPQEAVDSLADVIKQGGDLPPNIAAQFSKFQRALTAPDGQADARSELMQFLIDKGEDAPMAVDALIDFKNYVDNMRAGRPHYTYVNAYVDGKTNGIANQGMMLGLDKIALRVGALRGVDAEYAVDGGDIRDEMARVIADRMKETIPVFTEQQLGQYDKRANIIKILDKLARSKDINKKVTMVFPYGKEIPGLRDEIRNLIPSMRAKDPELDSLMTAVNMDAEIINAAHDNVVYALFEIFGQDTFNARGTMRAIGFMHAVTDNLFSLRGPSGHRILLGDYRLEEQPKSKSRVAVKYNNDQDKPMALHLQESGMYMSSAAEKGGEPAGYVRGRSSVIPTQSMDSATVVRTVTGSSWKKLKEAHPAGEPYVFQIYDAYKVDVNSYYPLVEEVNKNFLDITTRDWNFIDEGRKELNFLRKKFLAQMKEAPEASYSFPNGKFSYLFSLLDPEFDVSSSGATYPTYRTLKGFLASVYPIDPDMNYVAYKDDNGRVISVEVKPLKPEERAKISPMDRIKGYNAYIAFKVPEYRMELLGLYNKYAGRDTPKVENMRDLNHMESSPKRINSRQAYAMFDYLLNKTDLEKRLGEFAAKSNRNREALRKRIEQQQKDTGIGVLQFWAH